MHKAEVGVIGLGKFGMQLALSLTELGHTVVGLDTETKAVQHANQKLSAVYEGDATDKKVLSDLHFQDFDRVALSVGHSMESSIIIALNLREIGVKHIIAKAMSPQHSTVLHRLGVDTVIQPEIEIAKQTAMRITSPGALDLLPVAGGVLVQKVIVDAWGGSSLASLALPSKYGIMVVAKKCPTDKDFLFVPDATTPLCKGEELLLIGEATNILKLQP